MLKMAQIEYIKHLYEVEEKSLNEIAKIMNLNYRTVRKYAVMENLSPNIKKRTNKYPVLGPFLKIIDTWLNDDLKRPRKQRHTAKRVFDRLVEEYEFKGSLRTVSDYVSKKKHELYQSSKGYLPIEHVKGEAQLDFGEMHYLDSNDKQTKGHYLTLSFPHSNAAFTQIFESQNLECVMEGLKRFFRFLNGVPKVIVMDNLKPVVTKILKEGNREITEGFKRFALHYRFEMKFCNPSSGNEKGNVENKIGYHRRNFFVPMPKIDDLESYNNTLWDKALKDMNRQHYQKQVTIASLWDEDKENLLYLPEHPYEVFKFKQAKVNKYGCILVDNNSYSISPDYAQQLVDLKIYYNKIEVFKDHQLLLTYDRCYGKKQEVFQWKQYLSLLSKKPSGFEYTKFYDQIPKIWREHILSVKSSERKSALMLLKEVVENDDLENATQALELARLYGKVDTNSIRQCYYGLTHDTFKPEACQINSDIPSINYNPNLFVYDSLTRREVI